MQILSLTHFKRRKENCLGKENEEWIEFLQSDCHKFFGLGNRWARAWPSSSCAVLQGATKQLDLCSLGIGWVDALQRNQEVLGKVDADHAAAALELGRQKRKSGLMARRNVLVGWMTSLQGSEFEIIARISPA